MRVLFEVRHPAHVHHFAPLIIDSKSKGDEVVVLASSKEMTTSILDEYGFEYITYGRNRKGVIWKLIELVKQDFKLLVLFFRNRPDLVVGRPSHPLTLISWVLGIPALIFAEDDVRTVFFNAMLAHPFSAVIVSPFSTDLWKFDSKKIEYFGSQKVAYINPNVVFDTDAVILKYGLESPYCIIRASSLSAGHDIYASGLSKEIILKIIDKVKNDFHVYISSENELDQSLSNRHLKIENLDIHSVMKGSSFFISDSQSMTIECALLGVPNIRYSSFVGKLKAFEELENLKMTISIHPDNGEEDLLSKVDLVLKESLTKSIDDQKEYWKNKTDITAMSIFMIDELRVSQNRMKTLKSFIKSDVYLQFQFGNL